jgi:hypothetical protein
VGVTFDFFERFLGLVAITNRNGETVAGETKDVAGAVYTVVTSSPGD